MIQALLVDFYGTLVEEDNAVIASIVERVARSSARAPAPREISSWWAQRFAALCADAHGERFRKQREIELDSLRQLLERYASPLDAAELSAELFAYWARPRPIDGAERFLRDAGLPICIVSNIDACDLDSAIASLGWSFDAVVTSEWCRAYKPRPEPFRAALAALGCAPDSVLHVGDSLGSDVRGAADSGIPMAWVNTRGRALPADVGIAPRHTAASIDEISAWLRRASAHS